MRRTVNIEGFRRILRGNTDVPYGASLGFADDGFYIHLTDGGRYYVKEGYYLNWGDDDELSIEERSSNFKKTASDRYDNASGFWDTLVAIGTNLAENAVDGATSHTAEIEWSEIRDIDSV
jgi:hypothetical protein